MKKIVFINKLSFVFFLFILFFVALQFSACANNFNLINSNKVTFTDQLDREVCINKPINKISSGYYISTSALVALGQKDKLVTIDDKTKSIPLFKNCIPEVANLSYCSNTKNFNVETALINKTEAVVIPKVLKDFIEKFDQANLASIVVGPEDFDSFNEMIDIMAKAFDCKDIASRLTGYIDQQYENLSTMLSVDNYPSIYFASNSNILRGAVSNSFQNHIIKQSGCVNVLEDIVNPSVWQEIGYENLVKKNPDYIILASNSSYTVDDVLQDPKLSSCKAVSNKHVYKMPGTIEYWDSPIPGSFLGAYWLASVVHSDKVHNNEYKNRAVEFYEKFYKVNVESLIW